MYLWLLKGGAQYLCCVESWSILCSSSTVFLFNMMHTLRHTIDTFLVVTCYYRRRGRRREGS